MFHNQFFGNKDYEYKYYVTSYLYNIYYYEADSYTVPAITNSYYALYYNALALYWAAILSTGGIY